MKMTREAAGKLVAETIKFFHSEENYIALNMEDLLESAILAACEAEADDLQAAVAVEREACADVKYQKKLNTTRIWVTGRRGFLRELVG